MTAFLARFVSLGSYRCFERRVLLDLAALRAGGGALVALVGYEWQAPLLGGVAILLAPCNAVLWALICADFLERALRMLAFGYVDNVNVSPRCELEGGNMPTEREHEAEWRKWLLVAVWPDEKYQPPIPTLAGRVRALWR